MPKASSASDHRPVLLTTVGRQRVGKTTFLNILIQALRAKGAEMSVWNADQLNTTHNLALFHGDVVQPLSADMEDVKAWLEERIQDQIEGQFSALLDVGGGETPLSKLVREVPIVRSLERRGIRVVLVHVIGPDPADIDYLAHYMRHDLFAPEATLIVLNGGLVLSGRSVGQAFEPIVGHPVILEAMAKGAKIVSMPALACMNKVTDLGLTFVEASEGLTKSGQPRLSFFDQERVGIWWERDIPAFLESIPPTWLPPVPSVNTTSGQRAGSPREAADA